MYRVEQSAVFCLCSSIPSLHFRTLFVDWLDNYHKDDDPDGDPDDNVDVVVNLLHEDGPAATEVEGYTVGTIRAEPTGLGRIQMC